MPSLQQKTKLVGLLRKMGDPDYNEQVVLNQILKELESIRSSIPKKVDLAPYDKSIDFLSKKVSGFSSSVSSLLSVVSKIDDKISSEKKNISESNGRLSKNVRELFDDIKKEIEAIRKLATREGGGSMNRAIYIGNANPLTRYTDINLIAGNNVTITYQNNDTTKRTDITIAATGGGGGGGIVRSISSVSTNTNAGSIAGTDYVYLCSGTMTLTLPDAIGNTNLYTVKNVGIGIITVNTTASQTIDGSLSINLPVRYTSVDLESDTANWNVT